MLRIRNISQASQQRTLRVLYGQTQAYPYATTLSPVVYDISGGSAGVFSTGSGANPGTAGQGPIFPGMVAALAKDGQSVAVCVGSSGTASALTPFGLFANFVGGDFDEVGDYTEVGVWKGPGSVYEILSPAFNSAITSSNDTGLGTARLLYPDANGKLSLATAGSVTPVARLIDWVSASKIIVELLV